MESTLRSAMQIVRNGNNHVKGNGIDIARRVNGIVQPFLCGLCPGRHCFIHFHLAQICNYACNKAQPYPTWFLICF